MKKIHSLAVLLAIGLAGCGASDENPVPTNATVQVNPSSIPWEIPERPIPCPVNLAFYNDHTIAISVVDSNNSPLGNVDLRITADLSGNTHSGIERIKVYDDLNGNGVVDDPDELVSSNISPAFTTKTSNVGTKLILVRVNLSCPYRGNLNVYAGSAFGSTNIEVSERTGP